MLKLDSNENCKVSRGTPKIASNSKHAKKKRALNPRDLLCTRDSQTAN